MANFNFLFNFVQFVSDIWANYQIPVILGGVALIGLIVLIVVNCKCKKASKKAKVVPEKVEKPVEEVKAEPVEPEVIVVEQVPEEVAPTVVEESVVEETTAIEPVVETPAEEPVVVEEKPAQKKPTAKKPSATKKPSTVKKTPATPTGVAPVKPKGKWAVEFKKEGEYVAKLYASNGEEMLSSEIYSSEEGARNGIQSIINSVDTGKFVIYQDKGKNYYYKLKTSNNRLMCVGEIYKTRERCQKAVESVKRIAKDAIITEELVKGAEYVEYKPIKNTNYEVKNGATGKWKIEQNEEGKYSAKLYASNGQLMLATEEVALLKSAENAIDSVKKNSAAGHFIIDRDKFGRYYYKLRNAQKSVICIGEAYKTLESCISALESVRRFAATAIVEEF